MKAFCKSNIEIEEIQQGECPEYSGGFTSVFYYPESNEVYDILGNYIGKGELQDGRLVIKLHYAIDSSFLSNEEE